MKFFGKYKQLLGLNDSPYSVIALTGGRGSAKTGHALRGILTCLMQQKKKCCFFRETKETVNQSLKAELEELVNTEFSGRGFSFTNTEFRHINGSQIFFKGLKEVNSKAIENLKGIASSTDFFVVDEAQAVSKPVWDALIPTLRKKGCVLIVIYNRIADDLPVEEALFLDYHAMSAPEGTYFIEVNYTDILHLGFLSSQFIERAKLLQKNKPKEYEMIYLNKPPDLSENAVIKNFSKDNIKSLKYIDELDLHISCDFNVDPMCWIFAHKAGEKVFYFDELIMDNTTTAKAAEEVIRRYGNHKGKIIINGDASGDNRSCASEYTNYVILKNVLEKHFQREVSVQIRRYNPSIKSRIAAFEEKLLNINGERCIYIDEKCAKLIYNLRNLKYKVGTRDIDLPGISQIKTSPNYKYLMHPFDAASYLVEFYFPISLREYEITGSYV